MASLQMRPRPDSSEHAGKRRRLGLRLLSVERSEEIFPVLLEEIVALGFPRVLVARVNLGTSEVAPVGSLNCSRSLLQRFRTSLYAMENPLVRVLHSLEPELAHSKTKRGPSLYFHPLVYRNHTACREAERARGRDCLALGNDRVPRHVRLQEQMCTICDMHGYAAATAVEVKRSASMEDLSELRALIELANHYLSRLFKTEHYYNRMMGMETIIGQMQTVMESMTDPVILTDPQHRVITQNKAAERFFKVPEEVSEGRVRAVELNNLLFSAALSSMAVSGNDSSRDMTLGGCD